MGAKTVGFLNLITRLRKPKCPADSILILLPSCLQNSECTQNVSTSIGNCLRCGKCKIADILNLSDKYECHVAVAKGGRLAMKLAKRKHIKAIIAVACEVELEEGLKGVFPKPALGVINIRPHGPCKDTDVRVEEVEGALRFLGNNRKSS